MAKGRKVAWMTAFAVGVVLLISALVASVSASPSGVTFGLLRRGNFSSDSHFKANVAPAMAISSDGTNTFTHSFDVGDFDTATGTWSQPYCYSGKLLPPAKCPLRIGVFYNRSTSGGQFWDFSQQMRLNPDTQWGARPTICADGSNVIAAWVSQTTYYASGVGSGPRVLYLRTNNNYGDSASWAPMMSMTSAKGRVDYPYLACAAGRDYLSWTDSNTGNIYVATSTNGGATWSKQVVAKTTGLLRGGPGVYGPNGYGGLPAIGVSDDGMTLALGYLTTDSKGANSKLIGLGSVDGGATWQDKTTLATRTWIKQNAPTSNGAPTASGGHNVVGVAWIDPGQANGFVDEYQKGDGWQPTATAISTPNGSIVRLYSLGVGLQGTHNIGIAFGNRVATQGVSMYYSESLDTGQTWSDPQLLFQGGQGGSNYYLNWNPTIVWNGPTSRHVMWQGYSVDWFHYIRGYKVGTGA
jgi:hypothetical protein